MDTDQLAFFEVKTKEATKGKRWLLALREKLLSIGGSGVVLWNGSNEKPLVALLMKHGHVYPTKNIGRRNGEVNRCHENAQRWAEKQPRWYNYATGYALESQIWRPHSWLFNFKKRRIIETTVLMETYFGIDFPAEIMGQK